MEIEINTIIRKIEERCEKGRSIELTPIGVNHLLVHIREQEKKIERLRAEIYHMKTTVTIINKYKKLAQCDHCQIGIYYGRGSWVYCNHCGVSLDWSKAVDDK